MPTTVTDPLIGRRLDGRYRILRQVARGGMATIYLATDTRLGRQVAVKVMRPSLAEDAAFVHRFNREARAAAALSHPNVVPIYDQGTDDGLLFLVMEYIDGITLRDLLRSRGAMSPARALTVAKAIAAALSAAHAKGIVHRDIKPENVLLARDGRILVADFGLARAVESKTMTSTGTLIGTAAYMAPEQITNGVGDQRTDIYSAGVVMWETLVGGPPFDGESAVTVAYKHVHEDIPRASRYVALPADLDDLVLAATRRDPAARPLDGTDLARRLAAIAPIPAARTQTTPAAQRSTLPLPVDAPLATGPRIADEPFGNDPPIPLPSPLPSPSELDDPPLELVDEVADVAGAPRPTDELARQHGPVYRRSRNRRRGLIVTAIVAVVTVLAGFIGWYAAIGRYSVVPQVTGVSVDRAQKQLTAKGFKVTTSRQFSDGVAKDSVISQNPAGHSKVSPGATIALVVSNGVRMVVVPNLVDSPADQAGAALAKQNLVKGKTTQAYSDSIPAGSIISTKPAAGASVKHDSMVDLVVSKGHAPVDIPTVTGKSAADATAALKDLGFTVATSNEYSDTVPNGQVISQNPAAGTKAQPFGSQVSLVVSKGPQLFQVPNVVGMSSDKAKAALKQAGFINVSIRNYTMAWVIGMNQVMGQSVDAGQWVPRTTKISLSVI